MSEINLFTFLNQIQTKERTVPYDKKIANAYMLTLFLSMNEKYLKVINKINKYLFILPDEIIYEYYMNTIPKGKLYSKFIKKREQNELFKKRVNKLHEINPEMSTRECEMVISSLSKNVKEKK